MGPAKPDALAAEGPEAGLAGHVERVHGQVCQHAGKGADSHSKTPPGVQAGRESPEKHRGKKAGYHRVHAASVPSDAEGHPAADRRAIIPSSPPAGHDVPAHSGNAG